MENDTIQRTTSYRVLPANRIAKAFWTLNTEMQPANKVTFIREIDATGLDKLRISLQKKTGIKPSYTALIIKAATIVLLEFPYANRAILGLPFCKRVVQFNDVAITVAIERDVPGAEAVVLADTISGTRDKSLEMITRELQEFANATLETNPRWRLFYSLLSRLPVWMSRWVIGVPRFSARLWAQHRGGACFVNSPAKYGIDFVVADMIWPLTVMFGWVKERPLVYEGEVVARKTMPLSIIFDRRIMAGAPAARFFSRLAELLEEADQELLS